MRNMGVTNDMGKDDILELIPGIVGIFEQKESIESIENFIADYPEQHNWQLPEPEFVDSDWNRIKHFLDLQRKLSEA